MTQSIFNFILQTRANFSNLVDSLSIDQLNKIPEGFSNNIAWNLGHIAVAFPGLMYLKSQVDPSHYITNLKYYRPGSKPEQWINQTEIDRIKAYLVDSTLQIKEDYLTGKFATVTPFDTLTFKLNFQTAEEILQCSFAHDNYHFAYALAIKNLV